MKPAPVCPFCEYVARADLHVFNLIMRFAIAASQTLPSLAVDSAKCIAPAALRGASRLCTGGASLLSVKSGRGPLPSSCRRILGLVAPPPCRRRGVCQRD